MVVEDSRWSVFLRSNLKEPKFVAEYKQGPRNHGSARPSGPGSMEEEESLDKFVRCETPASCWQRGKGELFVDPERLFVFTNMAL